MVTPCEPVTVDRADCAGSLHGVALHLDEQHFVRKPTSDETAHISRRIARVPIELSVGDLAEAVTCGRTFTPGVFDGNGRSTNT